MKERDIALGALRDHRRVAQEKMKSYADLKRRHVEFEGDMVYLKIRPYRQVSMRKRRNEKLSPKYFGLYKILKRIGPVAYKLELSSVFHVSQLKRSFGECKDDPELVPYMTENREWIVVPNEVYGYQKNDKVVWEVLMS